jgi:hypothetical protein
MCQVWKLIIDHDVVITKGAGSQLSDALDDVVAGEQLTWTDGGNNQTVTAQTVQVDVGENAPGIVHVFV